MEAGGQVRVQLGGVTSRVPGEGGRCHEGGKSQGGFSMVGGGVVGPPGELGDGDVSQVLSEASVVRCLVAIPRREREEAVDPRALRAGLETHTGDPPPTATVEVRGCSLTCRGGKAEKWGSD